jgi:RimJ/RimL family protein N-acetyltransferase
MAMLEMPVLETQRLRIRPFMMDDLPDVHRLLDVELHDADLHTDEMETLAERAQWLQWTVLNYVQLAKLFQPPYGDRAVTLRSTGQLVGACGFVPCLNAFGQLPSFAAGECSEERGRYSAEFGLFYAISPAHQRRGYATEAAQALVDYAFRQLHLKRVVATTDCDNSASIGVMRKLGMRVEKNPYPDPPWLQVVGVVENDGREIGDAGQG